MAVSLHRPSHQKPRKFTFFNMVTLIFDLWPWPSRVFEILSRYNPPLNFRSIPQTVQPWGRWQTNTHTQTHGTDFIPLIADVAGKNVEEGSLIKKSMRNILCWEISFWYMKLAANIYTCPLLELCWWTIFGAIWSWHDAAFKNVLKLLSFKWQPSGLSAFPSYSL